MINNKIIILGNSPHLKSLDFNKISSYFDTIGLNVAFRFWDKINWLPTHYACLDVALIDTHHKKIKQLIDSNKIKTFFLRKQIYKYYPNLKNKSNIYTLEQIHTSKHIIFHTLNHITTGSFATRFAIFLGYTKIFLAGMDGNYVNKINEAEKLNNKNNRLKISKNPKNNPNYFFDNYQTKGDVFHIANPNKIFKCPCKYCKNNEINHAKLHFIVWDHINIDLPKINEKLNKKIVIYSCNPNFKYFPQKPISKLMI